MREVLPRFPTTAANLYTGARGTLQRRSKLFWVESLMFNTIVEPTNPGLCNSIPVASGMQQAW
jgi:hypothetical protein